MRPIDADVLIDEIKKDTQKVIKQDDRVGSFWLGYIAGLVIKQPTIQPEPQWIPVSERLPEVGQTIIAQCRANIIKTLKLDSDGDWYQDAEHCYMSGFVVAWMPLPEAYKPNK